MGRNRLDSQIFKLMHGFGVLFYSIFATNSGHCYSVSRLIIDQRPFE